MANDYFKFKQFTIWQDKCAMKVTTVACIQGAWALDFSPKHILDIGAGTGLLSLMLAQRYQGTIDAVEIEPDAFGQLQENIAKNPWPHQINCYHQDIRSFAANCKNKYDLIISNPPFYQNQLKSSDEKVNRARHGTSLLAGELLEIVHHLLSESGRFSVLLPPVETADFIRQANNKNLFPNQQLAICDSREKAPSAVITLLSRKYIESAEKILIIKNEDGGYSDDFISLLKDYYLYL